MATTTLQSAKLLRSLYSACKSVNRDTKCIMPPINPNVYSTKEIQQEINKCLNYIERPYYSYLDFVSNKYSSVSHYERPYYYMNIVTNFKSDSSKKDSSKKDPPDPPDPPPNSDAIEVPPIFNLPIPVVTPLMYAKEQIKNLEDEDEGKELLYY